MSKNNPMTTHHIIPNSWGGNLRPGNVMRVRENAHRAIHTIFQDDTPIQRIRRLLNADSPSIHKEVYDILSFTLKKFEGETEVLVYNDGILNETKFLNKLHSKYANRNTR